MKFPYTHKITRAQLIEVLHRAGLNVGVDAVLSIDNGEEYDSRRAATLGDDGPLNVTWEIEVDVGSLPGDVQP